MMQKKSRATLAFASFLALTAFGAACATKATQRVDARQPAPSATEPGATGLEGPPSAAAGPVELSLLTDGIRDGLTGLSLETPARQEKLQERSREILALKTGKLAAGTKRARLEACQEDEPSDDFDAAFCRLTLKAAGLPRKARKSKHDGAARQKTMAQLVRSLRQGRVADFAGSTDAQVIGALKKIHNSSEIRPMIERALEASSCASTALLTGLGLKAEENFPDPQWRELSQALYARSAECGSDASAVKGTYRLGLLQVWDGKFDLAEASFARIADHADAADFRSRVLYWRHFCAKQRGDDQLRDQMKAALAKDHPMSLHGLVTSGASAMATQAPRISFRSALKPGLNAAVRVAEALQAAGARDTSIDALQPILEQAKGAEPEFQLYVGLLLTRAGDTLNKFKLLSGLFRDYPGLIAQESLEMLFPLHRFEIVRTHEGKADPYLVISLIRQESAFNDRARSRVGARGLMQLMPQTARRMERVPVNALFDAKTNIRLGVRFFSYLIERYNGDVEMALAAYNAGPEKVDVWRTRYPVENRLLFVDLIPFRETREYVASIARNYFFYKKLYAATAPVGGAVAADATAVGQAASPAPVPALKDRLPAVEKQPTPFKLFDS